VTCPSVYHQPGLQLALQKHMDVSIAACADFPHSKLPMLLDVRVADCKAIAYRVGRGSKTFHTMSKSTAHWRVATPRAQHTGKQAKSAVAKRSGRPCGFNSIYSVCECMCALCKCVLWERALCVYRVWSQHLLQHPTFLFLAVLGFELRASCLLSGHFTT
jgi:hypothetical protein